MYCLGCSLLGQSQFIAAPAKRFENGTAWNRCLVKTHSLQVCAVPPPSLGSKHDAGRPLLVAKHVVQEVELLFGI